MTIDPLRTDFNDPLAISLLLCNAVKLEPGDARSAIVVGLERWLRERGALSGDSEAFAELARGLDPVFSGLAVEAFEAALHLWTRGEHPEKVPMFAPDYLKGASMEGIVAFILTGEKPSLTARKR